MNKQSNTYTILYSAIMVIVVGAVLALVYGALKPKQEENIKIDKMKQMLSAVRIVTESDDQVIDTYNKYIPEFFKSCGHYIVWEKETSYDVPDVVKALMKQRNCDVAIYLMLGWGYVANYDKSKNRYWLDMFKPHLY